MLLYWSFINFALFMFLGFVSLMSLLIFVRELLNKKNYIIQLTGTTAENLQEIQTQCQEILNPENSEQTKKKPKFQLMELSKLAIQNIQNFIKQLTFARHQKQRILENYHYIFNFMKDESKYPKIVLRKNGMIFILLFNLLITFQLVTMFQKYSDPGKMEFKVLELMLISLISLILTTILNKYLVQLQKNHCYYVLFNKLKFKDNDIEQPQKKVQDNTVYMKKRLTHFIKPIQMIVNDGDEQDDEDKRAKNLEMMCMKIDSQNDFVIEEDDSEMIERLGQQEGYNGIYYYMLVIISIEVYLVFIQYHYLFHVINSNYYLIVSLVFCSILDCGYRLVFCVVLFGYNVLFRRYRRINFGKQVKRIQIYEVFEEHIKLGITCLDENYSEEDSEDEQVSTFSDYSFISVEEEEEEKKKKPGPRMAVVKQDDDDEHWFIKAFKRIKKGVDNNLEQAHLGEDEYQYKNRDYLQEQYLNQQQKEDETDLRAQMMRQQQQIQEYLAEKERLKRQEQIQYQFMDPDQLMNQDDRDKLDSHKRRVTMEQNGGLGGLKTKYRQSQIKDLNNNDKFQMALRNSVFRDVGDFNVSDESSIARSNGSSRKVKSKRKLNQTGSGSSIGSSQQATMYDGQSDSNSFQKQRKVRNQQMNNLPFQIEQVNEENSSVDNENEQIQDNKL